MVLVQRHWNLYGPRLMGCCCLGDQAEAMAPSITAQAEAMEREQDGVRKAILMHGLLRAIVNRNLDAIMTLLSPKNLAAVSQARAWWWDGAQRSVDPRFEPQLEGLRVEEGSKRPGSYTHFPFSSLSSSHSSIMACSSVITLSRPQAPVDPTFEDALQRLTSAAMVLHGSPSILVDDLGAKGLLLSRGSRGGLKLAMEEVRLQHLAKVRDSMGMMACLKK